MHNIITGVDLAKEEIQVCVCKRNKVQSNQAMTPIEFGSWLASSKPMIIVFNKIDAYVPEPWDETELIESRSKKNYSISEWKKTWMNSKNNGAVFISARMNNNIGRLKKEIFNKVKIFSKAYNNL